MRLRRLYLVPAAVLTMTAVAIPAIASSEPLPVEAVNEPPYNHHWSNAQQTVIGGAKVKFVNPYPTTYHGLKFTGGTAEATPNCTGLPPAASTPNGALGHWEGECTFSKAGTYTFVCTVHPEMTGTITVKNPGEPLASTEPATGVTEIGATLHGDVSPEGHETKYFFRYGLTTSYESTPTPPQKLTSLSTPEGVSVPLGGLAAGTTYHFQLVAENSLGTVHGADEAFTTTSPPGAPTATTGIATSVSETSAMLKGTVNPDGLPTGYLFEWGLTTGYGQLTSELPAGEDHNGHTESTTLTGLAPGTVYHFRLSAKNGSGPSTGADGSFTTASPPTPLPLPPAGPVGGRTPPTLAPPVSILTPKPESSPVLGSALVASSLKLIAPRHTSSLRVSVQVAQAGAGGRLELELLTKGSLLGKGSKGSRLVLVGRVVRRSTPSGGLSLSVALTARAKHVLTRRHSLPLTVKIVLTPTQGSPQTLTRTLTLRL
jgi:plastocyanin